MDTRGVTLGDKHSYDDYGVYLNSIYIPMPDVKKNVIDIPYADGSVDLTEVSGKVNYKDREGLSIEFGVWDKSYAGWASIKTRMATDFHGQKIRMILDDDKGYYYNVRLTLDSKKSNPKTSKITLSGSADPYKYSIQSFIEPWLWNPFNFETGVIVDTGTVNITANQNKIKIPITGMAVVPTFIVSRTNNLALLWDGDTYIMPNEGKYRFPAVKIGDRDIELTFEGTGTVSVDFRGAWL